jgi:hypothetical protein
MRLAASPFAFQGTARRQTGHTRMAGDPGPFAPTPDGIGAQSPAKGIA